MIQEINGDITEIECDYICQQNNCIAVKPHGLSKAIFEKLKVCPYSKRQPMPNRKNLAIVDHRPELGSIEIIKSPMKNVSVICMFAQYSYGKVNDIYYFSRSETKKSREKAFEKCLAAINKTIDQDSIIAFPKYIGCNLAEGIWDNYYKMITIFSENRNVIIVNFKK